MTSSNASSARQALLNTINERERELTRIRHAADKCIEDEHQETTKQLQTLQYELIYSQKLTQEKDDIIQSLHSQMDKLEQDCVRYQHQTEDRVREEIERYTDKIRKELENEHKVEAERFEEQVKRRLKLEFEDNLMSCETKLRKDYQSSLEIELEKHEKTLWSNFDKMLCEKQFQHDQSEKQLKLKLEDVEKDLTDLSCQHQRQLDLIQNNHVHELQGEKETFAQKITEYEKLNTDLSDQKVQLSLRLIDLEDQLHRAENANSQYQIKVQELLDVIQCAEETFVHSVHEYQFKESEQQICIEGLSSKVNLLEKEIHELRLKHKKEVKTIKRKNEEENTSLKNEIKKLQSDIKNVCRETNKESQTKRKSLKEKEKEIQTLSDDLETIRIELKNAKYAIDLKDDKIRDIKRELDSMNEKEEKYKVDMRELRGKLQECNSIYETKIHDIILERDTARQEKENTMKQLCHKQNELSDMKLSIDMDDQSIKAEILALKQNNRLLQLKIDEVTDEKVGLKETISNMRKEMETMMKTSSPSKVVDTYNLPHHLLESSEIELLNIVLKRFHESSNRQFDKKSLLELRSIVAQINHEVNSVELMNR